MSKIIDFLRKDEIFILLFFWILYSIFSGGPHSWNDSSRLALVQSLIEYKKFNIDDSIYNIGDDRAYINGKYYSDKPPGTSFFGSIIYFILYNFLNLSFSKNESLVYFLITAFSVSLISAIGVLYVYKISCIFIKDKNKRLIPVLAYGIGSLIFPFSTVFVSHSIVVAFIIISFYYIQKFKLKRNEIKYFYLSFLFLGFCILVEYQSFLVVGLLILYNLSLFLEKNRIKYKMIIVSFVVFCLPIVLALFYNFKTTGNLFDIAYLHTPFFPEDYNRPKIERIKFEIIYKILFSLNHGFFVYSPIFLLFFLFLFNSSHKFKKEKILFLFCFLSLVLFNSSVGDNIGGCTFGNRKMITAIPFMIFSIIFYLTEEREKLFLYLILLLIITSIVINFLGAITNPFMCSGNPILDAFGSLKNEKCWKFIFSLKYSYEKSGCSAEPAWAEPSVEFTKISAINLFLFSLIILLLSLKFYLNLKFNF